MASLNQIPARRHRKRGSSLEYRVILSAAFGVFLVSGLIEGALRLVGLQASATASEIEGSTVSRAYEAANRCASYAFMG